MKYRPLSAEINEEEIKVLLDIVYPDYDVAFESMNRHQGGYVEVFFRRVGEVNGNLYQVDLLPDDIYVYEQGEELDGKLLDDPNIVLTYQKYMVAQGYSMVWKNNFFTKWN